MCGIAGIFDLQQQREPDRELLAAMNQTQFHRGPDEGGLHTEPGVGLAQGRLVVASDVGGHKELVHHGDTGLLFAAGGADALAAAVNHLLARRDDWRAIRERGRRFVEQERTWPLSVACYESVYRGLV